MVIKKVVYYKVSLPLHNRIITDYWLNMKIQYKKQL